MNPKLKVFLSSSQFQDEFNIERESLPVIFDKQPLTSGFCLWKIEDYASPATIEEQYLKNVKDSDIMILLIGENYRDAVHNEFLEAIKNDIKIFSFIKTMPRHDEMQNIFIKTIREKVTTASYNNFADLCEKIESSLYTYYLKESKKPVISQWKEEREKHKYSSDEERSLRLLAGILVTDAASSTKHNLIETILTELLNSFNGPVKESALIQKSQKILSYCSDSMKTDFVNGLKRLMVRGDITKDESGFFTLKKGLREKWKQRNVDIESLNNNLIRKLYDQHKEQINGRDYEGYKAIILNSVSQIVYESAVDMAEQEFGSNSNPFPYDADELNRIVARALTDNKLIDEEEISLWLSIVISTLESHDPEIISWLNRYRKAYWMLTILGMDPKTVEYTGEHLKQYCIYFDSHIVLRAMVSAGGDSEICENIISISRSLGIEMRLSHSLFQEIYQAFNSANKAYYAAGEDITRAYKFLDRINRKSDIFDGFLSKKSSNKSLTWDNYINRFYSPSNEEKLINYLNNEMGIIVKPERDFTDEQFGRIEDITQQLLYKRRQMLKLPEKISPDKIDAWERQYLLRTNEARQMAIIYLLRKEISDKKQQYWFVTFDRFVYEVSSSLVANGDDYFKFPCYMKPSTWLDILIAASPKPLSINTFREVLISKDIQFIANQIESEVISLMLQQRVDENISSIETLKGMFSDIVNRPAVQEAYQAVLEAEGIKKIDASENVKDSIIEGMKEQLSELKEKLTKVELNAELEKKGREKAQKKAKYLKNQVGRLSSNKSKKGKKKR